MKALKPLGLLGSNNAHTETPRRRTRRRAIPQPRGAAQAARRARRGDAAAARPAQAAGSGHRPRPGNVRVAGEAARVGGHRTIYPGFLSPARTVGRRTRDHRAGGAGARGQAGRARTQGVRAGGQPPPVPAAPGSEQQLRQAESQMVDARQQLAALDARLAKLDKWWHRWQRPKVAAQRPALQAASRPPQALLAARARCEQIEKAGAGEFPGISVESRRAINLAAIACAEVLCLRLARTNPRGVGPHRDVATRSDRILRRSCGLRVHHERHRQGAQPAQAAQRDHPGSRSSAPNGCAPPPPISANSKRCRFPSPAEFPKATCSPMARRVSRGQTSQRARRRHLGSASRSCCAEHRWPFGRGSGHVRNSCAAHEALDAFRAHCRSTRRTPARRTATSPRRQAAPHDGARHRRYDGPPAPTASGASPVASGSRPSEAVSVVMRMGRSRSGRPARWPPCVPCRWIGTR